jgi:hypothetical protein|tara:strand:+ start:534 stop:1442 length:909 start_codon:yes stop_codon:yes gene_type:complete
MDVYGITTARSRENELHAQSDMDFQARKAEAKNKFDANTLAFNTLKSRIEGKYTDKDYGVGASDAGTIDRTYQTGVAIHEFAKGAGAGFSAARTPALAGEELLAESGGLIGATRGAGRAASLAAGARGGAAAVTKLGGAAKGISGELQGVERIAQKGALAADLSKEAAFTVGKVAGSLGAIAGVGSDIDSLIQTGNPFRSVSTGKLESKTDIWGNLLTIGGGILDVAAAFTGGAMAPLAAAVNVAAAATSTAGEVQDEEAAKAGEGPKPTGPLPTAHIAPEFATLGFVANQAHDPTKQIRAN